MICCGLGTRRINSLVVRAKEESLSNSSQHIMASAHPAQVEVYSLESILRGLSLSRAGLLFLEHYRDLLCRHAMNEKSARGRNNIIVLKQSLEDKMLLHFTVYLAYVEGSSSLLFTVAFPSLRPYFGPLHSIRCCRSSSVAGHKGSGRI